MNLSYLRYKITKPFKSWKNKYLKSLTKKEGRRLGLYEARVKEISQYTGEPEEEIKRKHHLGPQSEKDYSIFKEHKNPPQDELDRFYRNSNFYLYELALWNAETNRPRYLSMITSPYLKRNGYKKVMDFGAGTGDFCIELAQNHLEVTYSDIGKEISRFAKWRFSKRGLDIKMIEDFDSGQEKYDCIFSFDAFEHLKNLSQVVEKISQYIRKGGSLIFSGAFSGGTLHLEENEKYNDFTTLDNLMQNCGLFFQDKFAQFYFYKK